MPQPTRLIQHPGLQKLYRGFVQTEQLWGDYAFELTWESVGRLEQVLWPEEGAPRSVIELKRRRGEAPSAVIPYQRQPFACLELFLWESTGEEAYLDGIHAETRRWSQEAVRDAAGNYLHEGRYLLIDRLQEFAGRCIRIGCLRDDEDLVTEGLRQWTLQEKILRLPQSGLWGQGRDWVGPGVLSPGAWSRGQGWVLRGLTESLCDLPSGHPGEPVLRGLLEDLMTSLQDTQACDGSWHRLLNRPPAATLPDSSGTGMIVAYICRAIHAGWIEETPQVSGILERAVDYLYEVLDAEGRVKDGCPGPGPLESEEPYLGASQPSPDNEHHAVFAWMLAAAYSELKGTA